LSDISNCKVGCANVLYFDVWLPVCEKNNASLFMVLIFQTNIVSLT